MSCALALLEASEEVRRSPLGRRLRLGRTRIGIETGPAIVGDIGGSRKLDYTAHGNAMNAAARLEAANKDLGSSICIGPGTAARLDPATLRQIGTLTLRGQSQPIAVYTPVSLIGRARRTDGPALPGDRRLWRAMRCAPRCAPRPMAQARLARPGRAILVPRPLVTATAVCTPTTVTAPRSTKTPNTPLLGPAKKRVPRTAIRPNGERTVTSCRAAAVLVVVVQHGTAVQHQHTARIHQEAIDAQPRFRAEPHLRRGAQAQPRADCGPVATASPTNTCAAGVRGRRVAAAIARSTRHVRSRPRPACSAARVRGAARPAASPTMSERRCIRLVRVACQGSPLVPAMARTGRPFAAAAVPVLTPGTSPRDDTSDFKESDEWGNGRGTQRHLRESGDPVWAPAFAVRTSRRYRSAIGFALLG